MEFKKNSLEDYIIDCIVENNIDIAVFSEYERIDFTKLEKNLGKMYQRVLDSKGDGKVTLIAKTTFFIEKIQPQNRYNIYNIKTAIKDYILVALHLEDRRNYAPAVRNHTIEILIADIEQTEKLFQCYNTIIIGDFNANPYDEELLSIYSFNSVLFKSIIEKKNLGNLITKNGDIFITQFYIFYLRIQKCTAVFIMQKIITLRTGIV